MNMSGEDARAASVAAGGESAGRPFGHMMPDSETALICEQDPVVRDKISGELKKMGFLTSEPAAVREALKQMRFHIFNIVFIAEDFDAGASGANTLLRFLETMNMTIRRQSFVVLVSAKFSTMNNMEAYHKSVNLIINKRDIGTVEKVLRQALAEHEDFYRAFKEKTRK
jgi:DNA-binding NtrC family response regulator